ncbi:MAG: carbonic anhydrase [Gammaproteobacteria bacterium]|nr:carbonic anhydrase [Gammaproteobacteria bacterium]
MLKKFQTIVIGISSLLFCSSIAWADANWSYSGSTGPKYWANLDPNYAECGWGKEQSPININASVHLSLNPLQFQFQAVPADLINNTFAKQNDSSTVENTHSLQDDLTSAQSAQNTMTINGDTYQLAQFHFHIPAEHRIRGTSYPMEIHLVYRDAQAHLAVVAIMVQQTRLKTGNSQLHAIAQNLNGQPASWQSATATIALSKLLPKDWRYYHYEGSLTVPPCIEGVQWYVMQQPISISAADLKIFKAKTPTGNARPSQPLNNRIVQRAV